ncbi:MAG: VWA domain-containing protein [Anaerolineae bacterium]
MRRPYGRTIDILLLLILLIVGAGVAALAALPTPPPTPTPVPTDTPTPTPSPTTTPTLAPLPTRRPTLTPSPTPRPTQTPSPTVPPVGAGTPQPTAPPGSTATPLPLVRRDAPLPHSALFIRRHNDFVFDPAAGLERLAEPGVNIDGTEVVFEEIASLSGVRIPGPDTDASLVLRYGLVEIPFEERRDSRSTHYLEVALKAAAETRDDFREAPPANYIFVVDTSGSMEGAKINGARQAILTLASELRPQDTLGIVDFDDQTRTVLPATAVGELNAATLGQALNRLVARGGTDINLGLIAGLSEIETFATDESLDQIFLFSDGNPTDGVTEWLEIRRSIVTAIAAAAADEREVGASRIRVSTFAFGEDANHRELDALAGITGGTYAQVTDPRALGLDLTSELNRRERLVAKDVRLRIPIDTDVLILRLYAHDQVADPVARAALAESPATPVPGTVPSPGGEEEGIRIFVPDLALDEAYWVVFEIGIPEGYPEDAVGDALVQYVDTLANRSRQDQVSLALGAAPFKLPEDLVVKHALGLWTSDVAFYTLDDLAEDDLATADARLGAYVAQLQAINDELKRVWLIEDIEILEKISGLVQRLTATPAPPRAQAAEIRELIVYELNALARARNGFDRND